MTAIALEYGNIFKDFSATKIKYTDDDLEPVSINDPYSLSSYSSDHNRKAEIALANHKAIYFPNLIESHIPCIQEAIENSQYILKLEDGWDGDEALKIPEQIYNRALEFITSYCHSIYLYVNLEAFKPSINPMSDGSIDIKWNTDKGGLLINIKNSDVGVAFYYGETGHGINKIDFNGSISTNGIIPTFQEIIKSIFKIRKNR